MNWKKRNSFRDSNCPCRPTRECPVRFGAGRPSIVKALLCCRYKYRQGFDAFLCIEEEDVAGDLLEVDAGFVVEYVFSCLELYSGKPRPYRGRVCRTRQSFLHWMALPNVSRGVLRNSLVCRCRLDAIGACEYSNLWGVLPLFDPCPSSQLLFLYSRFLTSTVFERSYHNLSTQVL